MYKLIFSLLLVGMILAFMCKDDAVEAYNPYNFYQVIPISSMKNSLQYHQDEHKRAI